jgi:hypothetical protein
VRTQIEVPPQTEELSPGASQDEGEPFDALSADEFEDEAPVSPIHESTSESDAERVVSHASLVEGLSEQDPIQSVAPVAKIVRSADTETRKIPVPPEHYQSKAVQPVHVESKAVAQDEDSTDVEDDMNDLAGQESYVVADGARERLEMRRRTKLVGFLVSFELDRLGRYIELREGRLLVSSEGSSTDNCLVISDPSVSSMHAIMRISSNGAIMILDQLSEHGTKIKRCDSGKEEALLGDKGTLEHGDVVIFGECAYHVCILKGI